MTYEQRVTEFKQRITLDDLESATRWLLGQVGVFNCYVVNHGKFNRMLKNEQKRHELALLKYKLDEAAENYVGLTMLIKRVPMPTVTTYWPFGRPRDAVNKLIAALKKGDGIFVGDEEDAAAVLAIDITRDTPEAIRIREKHMHSLKLKKLNERLMKELDLELDQMREAARYEFA